jgi:two-component system response regulator DctR
MRPAPLAQLSRREREVVERLTAGECARVIADAMDISVRTVESHTAHAYKKLGVRNRVQLVRVVLGHDRPRAGTRGGEPA